ncbi:serpin family protein [Pseudorhodoplanes sinuspersici]|nr:serpin family protein [Pseudorhodoplanes sinuspersici]RKE73961.1 serpin B [Pseudorhodoplanes sinuspersici]
MRWTVNHGAAAALILAFSLPLAPVSNAAEQAKGRPLTEAYNRSGQELLRAFAGQPGNIVFSPYSIGTAMAMVLSGARGDTQIEMHEVLRHALPVTEIDGANARALESFAAYNVSPESKPAPAATLRIANAMMLVNAAASVAPVFEETIRTQYGSEIFKGATLDTVNTWVRDKTEGKIEKILERLNPSDSHVLLNAVYFKAPWASAFSPSATRDRPFTLVSGEQISVPTMTQQAEFAIAKGEGFAAVRQPYAVDGLSMTIVLPDEAGGLDTLIAGLNGAKTEGLLQSVRDAQKRMVALSMPRFKFEFKADLIEPFKSFGMSKVFDPAQSDLSGLTGKPRSEAQSTIDQIVHRAVIEVAEEGTEAAAATAVVVTTRAMRPDNVERFQIDRPFLFFITDDKTGAILFEGRVSDPRS